uniref:Patatin like phospholipase domain containing 8 n=1 Tax=Scleropages formosus TaxID=113540 RepID=A0A8C9VGM3_SCLFO
VVAFFFVENHVIRRLSVVSLWKVSIVLDFFYHRAVGYLRWKQVRISRGGVLKSRVFRARQLPHGLGLSSSVSLLSTSAPCRHADPPSPGRSRLRSTLDTVSRAVSDTHTDLLSKFARLKLKTTQMAPQAEAECPGADPTPASTKDPMARSQSPKVPAQVNGIAAAPLTKERRETHTGDSATDETVGLFHPGKFPASLDQTYNYLAHHVNTYFGSAVKADHDDVKADGQTDRSVPVLMPPSDKVPLEASSVSPPSATDASPSSSPVSPKKGIGQYLSYPGHSVQAFVGSYIAPLVPKFRPDSKGAVAVKNKPSVGEETHPNQGDLTESKEQKAAEEKARRLLLQREKIIARVSVDNRTRALVQALQRASDVKLYISRVEDLSYHLLEFPETRAVAIKEEVIPCLLRLRQAGDPTLQAAVREALSLVGYTDPVKGWGIRVLSIDGGGTRGVVALKTLQRLEELTGKPTCQLFDYICGVSTGAILAFMLGVYQMPLEQCEELYRRLGSDVFKQNVVVGAVKMGWSHAFYDSEVWESILKDQMGSDIMVETSRNPDCPKVAAVSTIVNRGTPLKAYVFRNYNLLPGVRSHYLGGCHHKLWQAIRASSAAPGYFQEFVLGNDLHQDGGLLVNNPTAVALHESQCLWPSTPVQCVVSLGTGRFESAGRHGATHTSLRTKLSHVISSATDTEEVHTMLDALLPLNTYFRFNPCLREDIPLDERRRERLALLQAEGLQYLERNEHKLRRAAAVLQHTKSTPQRLAEWARLKRDMYQGLPFLSGPKRL